MNVHHLELFYYVARHGGISQAVRNIPYGIQQPAVSWQIAQLEEFLGTTLFQRRPFSLTPPGEKLYRFIEPFFSGISAMTAELQVGAAPQIRIGASDIVLREHLPDVLQLVRKKFPALKVALRGGYQPDLEGYLEEQEIDLAITLIERKPPPGIRSMSLIDLPLVLLVHKSSNLTSAQDLWRENRIGEMLICLPAREAICRNFQKGLKQRGVDWFPGIEVSSIDLVETYVSNGFGVGLSVAVPGAAVLPNVRALPLADFSPVIVGALWRGKTSPLAKMVVELLQMRALELRKKGPFG